MYIDNNTDMDVLSNWVDAWQAPLSLPLALSSHKRGMLAPLPSREGLNH